MSLLSPILRWFFAILGIVQLVYFVYTGPRFLICWYLPIPIVMIFVPFMVLDDERWIEISGHFLYVIFTVALLLCHYLVPPTKSVSLTDIHIEGHRVSTVVRIGADCFNHHITVQSAQPIKWAVVGESLQLFDLPLFTDFRVLAYCENLEEVWASKTYFADGLTVRGATASLVSASSKSRPRVANRHELTAEIPSTNPYYNPYPKCTIINIMWVIVLVKIGLGFVGIVRAIMENSRYMDREYWREMQRMEERRDKEEHAKKTRKGVEYNVRT
ncbi:hypothetical protein HDV00_006633 [Rhizophlyctis rosea]|nr:hypothetical protein HDV00_006633 [Rhizophlyctis rosea]